MSLPNLVHSVHSSGKNMSWSQIPAANVKLTKCTWRVTLIHVSTIMNESESPEPPESPEGNSGMQQADFKVLCEVGKL